MRFLGERRDLLEALVGVPGALSDEDRSGDVDVRELKVIRKPAMRSSADDGDELDIEASRRCGGELGSLVHNVGIGMGNDFWRSLISILKGTDR